MLKQISPLLQVRNLEASVAFYRDMLGFQTGSLEDGFSAIRRDDCTIYLAQKTKDVDVANRSARAVDDGWCSYDLHIHCRPGTLDGLFAEFTARGVRLPDNFENGPVTRAYGMRDFSVFDPDGYDLVFAEEVNQMAAKPKAAKPKAANPKSATPASIDEYLAPLSDDKRAALEKLRKAIKSAVPKAEEYIGYGLAAFRLEGKPLVAFGAGANHCSFYPMSSSTIGAHEDDLSNYETSKGTIRFPVDKPLSAALVRKLVKARVAENKAAK